MNESPVCNHAFVTLVYLAEQPLIVMSVYLFHLCVSFQYLVQRQYCKTVLMENLISKYLPSELLERQKIHQDEMAELSK